MALDARRQAMYRYDVICCAKMDKSSVPDVREKSSLLFLFMKKIWTRYIVLHPFARPFWVSCLWVWLVSMEMLCILIIIMFYFLDVIFWIDIFCLIGTYPVGTSWTGSETGTS